MSIEVPVLLIKTLPTDTGVNTIKNCLVSGSDITFTISVQEGNDYYTLVKNFLLGIYTPSSRTYAIYIFDTCVSISSPTRIREIIMYLINLNASLTYDILFLNRYLDNCNQYTDTRNISIDESTGMTLSRTTGAKGSDGLLLSPNGIKKFLNDVIVYPSLNETLYYAVNTGSLIGESLEPSLFEFSPNWATSNSDYVKTASCSSFKLPSSPSQSTSTLGFIIFILVVILILIVVWALFKVPPSKQFNFVELDDIKV